MKGTRRGAHLGGQIKRRVAGLTRQRSRVVAQRHEGLLCRLQELKAEHPFWGYRRI
jgi:hypothetical protein